MSTHARCASPHSLSLSAPRDPPGAILCAVNLPRDIEVKLRNGLWDGSGNIGVGVGGFARTPRSRRSQCSYYLHSYSVTFDT